MEFLVQTFQQARLSRLMLTPDAGDGEGAGDGGAPAADNTPAASGGTENTGQGAGGGSGEGGGSTPDNKGIEGLQGRVSELSKEKRALEAKLKELEDAQASKEKEEAEKRGEWEKLAKKHSDELEAIKPKLKEAETERDELRAMLEAQVKSALESLSDRDKKLFPGDALPLAKQFEWVQNAKADAPTANDPAKNGGRGNSPDPKPAGQAATQQSESAARQAYAGVIAKRF